MFRFDFQHDDSDDADELSPSSYLTTALEQTSARASSETFHDQRLPDPPADGLQSSAARPWLLARLGKRNEMKLLRSPHEGDTDLGKQDRMQMQPLDQSTYLPSRAVHMIPLRRQQGVSTPGLASTDSFIGSETMRGSQLDLDRGRADTERMEHLLRPVHAQLQRLRATKIPPYSPRVRTTPTAQILKNLSLPIGKHILSLLHKETPSKRGALELDIWYVSPFEPIGQEVMRVGFVNESVSILRRCTGPVALSRRIVCGLWKSIGMRYFVKAWKGRDKEVRKEMVKAGAMNPRDSKVFWYRVKPVMTVQETLWSLNWAVGYTSTIFGPGSR